MNKLKHATHTAFIAMCLLFAQVDSSAAERDHETAKRLQEAGVIMPLETILKKQRQDDMGRILDVELDTEDGRRVYEIEYLDGFGAAWELLIDAQTGQLLRKQRDD